MVTRSDITRVENIPVSRAPSSGASRTPSSLDFNVMVLAAVRGARHYVENHRDMNAETRNASWRALYFL
jgi:hypothetical protein